MQVAQFAHSMLELAGRPPSPAEALAFARAMMRSILDQTPLPDQRFAIRRQPRPGRNDPCDCGSGRKFKQCCLQWESSAPPIPLDHINFLPYVLAALPKKRWPELVGSSIDPPAVADAARQMIDAGDIEAAEKLLDPWFKGEHAIPAAHGELLLALLDVCDLLDKPRKKQRLIEQGILRGDRGVRSDMHQRLASIHADRGDMDQAWRHFQQAQRENPHDISLSHLEVILLINQGDTLRARERARFWIARLQREDAAGHADLIQLLRDLGERGQDSFLDISADEWPELITLRELIDAAPGPAVAHEFRHGDAESVGSLHPKRPLAAALKEWTQIFPEAHPGLAGMMIEDHPAWDENATPWLDLLRRQPLLWQSFVVLDDLVLALSSLDGIAGVNGLSKRLLDRAETLLRLSLAEHPGKKMEWPWMENRPALRLLARRIVLDRGLATHGRLDDAAIERIEWMLALNPNDNHGFREGYAAILLADGDAERALPLLERYPDSDLDLARVLALFALDRRDQAAALLAEFHQHLPALAETLAAARPRKPKIDPIGYRYGGPDHAWLHRQLFLPAWQRFEGALDWLRQSLERIKQGQQA